MARQKGIIKIKGTIGGISFYKSQDGFLAREASSLDGDRVRTDPAFKRTRENGSDFATAAHAGKQFRLALKPLLKTGSDNRVIARLVTQLVAVIRFDTVNPRGKRKLSAGDCTALAGFECNALAPLGAILHVQPTLGINRVTGQVTAALPSFIPGEDIKAPDGTTHFKIVTAAAAMDFDGKTQSTDFQSTPELPWDLNPTAAINLQMALPAASTHPLFLLLGIQFFRKEGANTYVLNSKSANALQIAQVDA